MDGASYAQLEFGYLLYKFKEVASLINDKPHVINIQQGLQKY